MYVIAHNGAHIWGGEERGTALMLKGLQERGHRILLLCNDERVAERARELEVPAQTFRLGGDIALHDALRLSRLLRRHRPDALYSSTFRKMWLASLGGHLGGVPRVLARVGLETDTPRSAKYRFVLARWVDVIVTNAARMRPPFLALPGWTPERVVTIYNGVHLSARTQPTGAVRRALGIAPDARVIGAVARLAAQKRFDRLLRAMAGLPPDVHCVLAGDGEERARLEALAETLGLGFRVHFLGFRQDVADVLDALDLFVISSDREGMSQAMVEALAAGVPVVSTPVSGSDEALDPLPDGTAPGEIVGFDAEELAESFARLLADPARRARMGEAGRRRVRERFGFDAMIDRWERVFAGNAVAEPDLP